MKERPILMSAPMVRATLDDTKTQTRRIVKPQPTWCDVDGIFASWVFDGGLLYPNSEAAIVKLCPYGQPGDRLWVRESFSGPWCMEKKDGCAAVPPSRWGRSSHIWYWADGDPDYGDWTKPRPSIHMPRWASRITLEITGVRVERLQEISEADAIAEGIDGLHDELFMKPENLPSEWAVGSLDSPVFSFATLWQSINGPGSWDANPFVWCIEFRRIEQQRAAA